ncbi:MAG: hypothetical protein WD249_01195 [Gaiellaceae bacterium]
MARALISLAASLVAALAFAAPSLAGGGSYAFDGGTAAQQRQVVRALEASSFPWSVVPATITIHIAPGTGSFARPGHIWLDAKVLDAGMFSWAIVQDEYAHQVDFFLFDASIRQRLTAALGADAWCREIPGLAHDRYGCERFTSTLVWAYWPSAGNAYRPVTKRDESAAMAPARFRALMTSIIAGPQIASADRALAAARK